MLCEGGDFPMTELHPTPGSKHVLKLPRNLRRTPFSRLTGLHDRLVKGGNLYMVPRSKSFACVDAIGPNSEWLQMTIGHTHSIALAPAKELYNVVPPVPGLI